MKDLIPGQKVKIKDEHPLYGGKEGYFQFIPLKAPDCIVCSTHLHDRWNSHFVVGRADLVEEQPKEEPK
jgi:hypothetical protein